MNDELYRMAQETKILYKAGIITQRQAKEQLKPYEDHFNATSERIAKKYNQRAKRFSFSSFMR